MNPVEHENLPNETPLGPSSPAIVAFWRVLRKALIVVLASALTAHLLVTALRGIAESWNNDGFPEALAVKLELLPVIFPVHMVTGGLALLLVPLVLILRRTRWHKWAGRFTAVIVVVAGFTAIPVALEMPVTRFSAAGFTAQAITWMSLLVIGIWHIRHGRVAQHRAAMLMMAAVTSGAMFFRLYLAAWKLLGWRDAFETFYAIDAWIAWGLPLIITMVWLKSGRLRFAT